MDEDKEIANRIHRRIEELNADMQHAVDAGLVVNVTVDRGMETVAIWAGGKIKSAAPTITTAIARPL